jgi:hypothetical protein
MKETIKNMAHQLATEFVGTSRRDVTYEEAIDMLLAMAEFCHGEYTKKIFNLQKQLYCSDKNQKKEHGKFLHYLNMYNGEVKRRKKAELALQEHQKTN